MLRFIHTADLHLDRPFQGLMGVPENILNRVQESTFVALSRIVELSIKEKVDFIIMAGDIYDGENRSLLAQAKLRELLGPLEDVHIPVYITHGNHDHLSGKWVRLDWGKHIHFFSNQVEMKCFEKDGVPLAHLYGFSYAHRQVLENMTSFYKKCAGAPYHIGILHGFIQGGQGHDVYAPFSIDDLITKEFDYWALGHIHRRERLHHDPDIWYPGNPQGLSIKETGEKGCSLIELDHGNTNVHFYPTADCIWYQETVSIQEIEELKDLIKALELAKNKLRRADCSGLVRFILQGSGPLHHVLQHEAQTFELLDLLREGEEFRDDFMWITELKVETTPSWNREELLKSNSFISDLLELIDESNRQTLCHLEELYMHRRAKRFLEEINRQEENAILKEAENLLIESLLNQGDEERAD